MDLFKYIGLFIIILASSCREIFDDELTGSDSNVLVVEGVINDAPGPYKVKLSKSVFFDNDKRVVADKAEVYVLDDLNNRYDFKEVVPGIYFSDSAKFRGQMGRIYTLYINTKDSLQYKSTPCTIGPPSKIENAYLTGKLYSIDKIIYADLSFGSEQKMSTKIDADIALEHIIDTMQVYLYYRYGSLVYDTIHYITTFYTTKSLNYTPILKTNTDYVTGSIIKKNRLFTFNDPFIKTDTTRIDDNNIIAQTIGLNFILIINASTISNETFNYYYNLLTQIKGENTFFEPIPNQLTGNIKCINNNKKEAYGIFQANAIVKKYYYVYKTSLDEINEIPPRTTEIIDPNQVDPNL